MIFEVYITMIYVYLMKGLLLLVNMSINSYSYLSFFFLLLSTTVTMQYIHAILRPYLIALSVYPFFRPV